MFSEYFRTPPTVIRAKFISNRLSYCYVGKIHIGQNFLGLTIAKNCERRHPLLDWQKKPNVIAVDKNKKQYSIKDVQGLQKQNWLKEPDVSYLAKDNLSDLITHQTKKWFHINF